MAAGLVASERRGRCGVTNESTGNHWPGRRRRCRRNAPRRWRRRRLGHRLLAAAGGAVQAGSCAGGGAGDGIGARLAHQAGLLVLGRLQVVDVRDESRVYVRHGGAL